MRRVAANWMMSAMIGDAMSKKCVLLAAVALVAGCGDGEQIADRTSDYVAKAQSEESPVQTMAEKLSPTDLVRVCKAGAAFRVSRPVDGITAIVTDEYQVRLSYTRDDGKFFRYDCRVHGNELRYRMIDEAGRGTGPGSWSGRGSKTTFELNADSVDLVDDFLDGSTDAGTISI